MVLVKTFYAYNDLRNFSYLIHDNQTASAWVIDPYDATPIIDYIKKKSLVLKGILNTHQHFDHIRGNSPLVEAFGAHVTHLKSAETVSLSQDHELMTLDTPGHSMDHQVFIWKSKKDPVALFSGDTLFNSGVGNCRGGNVSALYETTHKLISTLPPTTLLYPGHDYRKRNLEFALSVEPENREIKNQLKDISGLHTEDLPPVTLEYEKMVNPFLRLTSQELRMGLVKDHISLGDEGYLERELFFKLRSLRDQW